MTNAEFVKTLVDLLTQPLMEKESPHDSATCMGIEISEAWANKLLDGTPVDEKKIAEKAKYLAKIACTSRVMKASFKKKLILH